MIYRNKNFTARNYECTNIVACVADKAPNDNYVPTDEAALKKLTHIYTENGIQFYGYL